MGNNAKVQTRFKPAPMIVSHPEEIEGLIITIHEWNLMKEKVQKICINERIFNILSFKDLGIFLFGIVITIGVSMIFVDPSFYKKYPLFICIILVCILTFFGIMCLFAHYLLSRKDKEIAHDLIICMSLIEKNRMG